MGTCGFLHMASTSASVLVEQGVGGQTGQARLALLSRREQRTTWVGCEGQGGPWLANMLAVWGGRSGDVAGRRAMHLQSKEFYGANIGR